MDKNGNTRSDRAPSVVKQIRTRFEIGGTRRFTCNTGDLVPFFCKEVLPSDVFDIKTVSLTRLETAIHQTLDNAYLEIAYFYVPNRIVMDDWDKLLGANDDAWARNTVVSTPQLLLRGFSGDNPSNVIPQSVLNHLMLPAGNYPSANTFLGLSDENKAFASVTQLPLRGYFQIFNDWFRDETVDSIIAFSKGNSDVYLTTPYLFNGNNFIPSTSILKVNRFRDRFSSALPAPQKGNPVTFNLGGSAPIMAGSWHDMGGPIAVGNGDAAVAGTTFLALDRVSTDGYSLNGYEANVSVGGTGYPVEPSGQPSVDGLRKSNLYADLSTATALTVNDLRLAIATQVALEEQARCGSRLTEILYSVWGIKAPSLMIDRSEYLGGRRIPLQMLEVLQTSSSTDTKALGEDAGHGKTFDASSGSAYKGFLLHGYVIGLAWIRTARSYSQGIDRQFFRKDKYTYFDPIFDNIGEVPVRSVEMFVPTFKSLPSTDFKHVFGYQEAWYEYKEGMNRDSGYMQVGINGTMETWHYGDSYNDIPVLSPSWMKEGSERVNRTIAVQATGKSTGFQWSIMLDIEAYATRHMHKYSIPNSFGFGSK